MTEAIRQMSTDTIHIYKVKLAVGTPIILPARQKILLPKGYSTISIKNTSNTVIAKMQIIPKNKQQKVA